MLPTPRKLVLLAVSLAVIAAVGCGDGTLAVRGTVSYDGRPVEYGSISFEPADGQGVTTGGPIVNGKYELTGKAGMTPGPKVVRIRGVHKKTRKAEVTPGKKEVIEYDIPYIPKRYNDFSKLKVEVRAANADQVDFELKSRP